MKDDKGDAFTDTEAISYFPSGNLPEDQEVLSGNVYSR